ncbi:hypothetical protein CF319_g4473 [Tilletia indica]|nr:hypothetical protein CF319_g4473 [Tilletia indica]
MNQYDDSSPRRNPRRRSTYVPQHEHRTTSPTVAEGECTCTLGYASSDGFRPDDWYHVFLNVENIKTKVTPQLHKWSATGRLRVAGAFRDVAHLCMLDQEFDHSDEFTGTLQNGPQQEFRVADQNDVFQFVEYTKMILTPYIHKWPTTGRLRVAAAFSDIADLCSDQQ